MEATRVKVVLCSREDFQDPTDSEEVVAVVNVTHIIVLNAWYSPRFWYIIIAQNICEVQFLQWL